MSEAKRLRDKAAVMGTMDGMYSLVVQACETIESLERAGVDAVEGVRNQPLPVQLRLFSTSIYGPQSDPRRRLLHEAAKEIERLQGLAEKYKDDELIQLLTERLSWSSWGPDPHGRAFRYVTPEVASSAARRIANLQEEIDRLQAGKFTPDELQNLCHNLDESDFTAFCDGCDEYQRKLFGKCRSDALTKITAKAIYAAAEEALKELKNPERLMQLEETEKKFKDFKKYVHETLDEFEVSEFKGHDCRIKPRMRELKERHEALRFELRQTVHESMRRDQKWKDGIEQVCGRKISFSGIEQSSKFTRDPTLDEFINDLRKQVKDAEAEVERVHKLLDTLEIPPCGAADDRIGARLDALKEKIRYVQSRADNAEGHLQLWKEVEAEALKGPLNPMKFPTQNMTGQELIVHTLRTYRERYEREIHQKDEQ